MLRALGCLLLLLASNSLYAEEETIVDGDPRDPYESFNRAMWAFNYEFLDPVLVRPTVHAYDDYVPELVKDSIGSFLDNLDTPFTAVNNLLQWKPKQAGIETLRFTINTTVGILGLFDVASDMGLPAHQREEFGEVMEQANLGNGPYLMLPFFGPTTVRDEVGDYVDRMYPPLSTLSIWQDVGRWALDGVNTRAALREQEALIDESLDPYAFAREAYFQLLEYDVLDGELPQQDEESDEWLDDYLDEIDQ
ncbi:VacJ family lipoprotein [Ferrimonas lipolytica]|uniref:VacJ family lipoprotein n=1 Tax=Ferrimonas lipolytica TaxID=2724191 RepID=A0A6H1UAJ4_9GAMM|nr:VacJ family lipoprotein [Ferrimonas lipolytica]QIZ75659.1 VacJ family lipoprotein [Ferrimonas lipolytica]